MASQHQNRRSRISKPSDSDQKLEKRKLRNRISQQAFRTRQNLRVQELEERLQDLTRPDAARMALLQDQNAALRNQLLECHKKLTSFQISVQELERTVAEALGIASNDQESKRKRCDRVVQPEYDNSTSPDISAPMFETHEDDELNHSPQLHDVPVISNSDPDIMVTESFAALDSQFIEPLQVPPTATIDSEDWTHVMNEQRNHFMQTILAPTPEAVPSQLPLPTNRTNDVIPKDWDKFTGLSLDHLTLTPPGIGLDTYQNILDNFPTMLGMPQPRSRKNSRFSDHIDAVEYFCLQNWGNSCQRSQVNQEFAQVVQFMLSAFVSISWSAMTTWHSRTRALGPLRDVMIWRLTKTQQAFLNITPAYRPTKLQMSVRYPSVIDWTPWPSLRDKLIIHHSANPRLDDLICEIGDSYVVPADLSELVACPQPVLGYIGVWDLIRAIDPDSIRPGTSSNSKPPGPSDPNFTETTAHEAWFEGFHDTYQTIISNIEQSDSNNININTTSSTTTLPAPTAKALFSSRALAMQAFKLLGMDQGAFRFCLDPAFFEKHPELYCADANLMACGVALRSDTLELFPAPQELDSAVIKTYGELSRCALAVVEASALAAA